MFPDIKKSRKYHPIKSYWAYIGLTYKNCTDSLSDKENIHVTYPNMQQMSLVCDKFGFELFVGGTDIKIMHKEKVKGDACLTIHTSDMLLKTIIFGGNEVSLLGFPKTMGSIAAFEYTFKKILGLHPCSGYPVFINNKKKKIVNSKNCQGYIFGTKVQCQKCSIEMAKASGIDKKASKHIDHSYAVSYPTIISPDPEPAVPDDPIDTDTDGELTETDDCFDDEDADPTYDPLDESVSRKKRIETTVLPMNAENIADNLLEQCPSLKSVESFKLLLIQQIKNSSVEKRRRRWDTE